MQVALRTERLVLREWRPSDRDPFAALNADPEVMEFFPSVLERNESDALIERFESEFTMHGCCPWAVERLDSGDFIGFIGLQAVPADLPFAPAVEVGWRLARCEWGKGYATEGGGAALRFGFEELAMAEIVSFTAAVNLRSRRVMERLGMTRALDFDHPRVPIGGVLRPHVLYRASHTS